MYKYYFLLAALSLSVSCTPGETPSTSASPPSPCCQVTVYKEPNFQGESTVLKGPGDKVFEEDAALSSWHDSVESLKVGECAKVTVYDEHEGMELVYNSDTPVTEYGPSQEEDDFEGPLDEDVEGLRIECTSLQTAKVP